MITMACIVERKSRQLIELSADIIKVIVMGAPRVGKTSFIKSFWEHHRPEKIYHLTDVTVYPCKFTDTDGISKIVEIFEIPGDPAFEEGHRTSHYRDAHAIVWMYAIDNPLSLKILKEWLLEAAEVIHLDTIVSVVVGNKEDLRGNPHVIQRLALDGKTPVTFDQVKKLPFYEKETYSFKICANTLGNVDNVFIDIFDSFLFIPD